MPKKGEISPFKPCSTPFQMQIPTDSFGLSFYSDPSLTLFNSLSPQPLSQKTPNYCSTGLEWKQPIMSKKPQNEPEKENWSKKRWLKSVERRTDETPVLQTKTEMSFSVKTCCCLLVFCKLLNKILCHIVHF